MLRALRNLFKKKQTQPTAFKRLINETNQLNCLYAAKKKQFNLSTTETRLFMMFDGCDTIHAEGTSLVGTTAASLFYVQHRNTIHSHWQDRLDTT